MKLKENNKNIKMKRIKILNKRIENFFQKKSDQDLISKLKTIKPTIDLKCPESYLFIKTQCNTCRAETKRNEQKLPPVNTKRGIKIIPKLIIKERNRKESLPFNIISNNPKNTNKNNNRNNNSLKHYISGKNIFEISKIFDDNINLSRRIREKSSYYSLSQLKEDFKRSREYKKISCEFPSINFIANMKKKLIKRNNDILSTKCINSLGNVRFVPIGSLGSESNREHSKNKERNNDNIFNTTRKKKFFKLFEKNNKIIFDKKYNIKKNKKIKLIKLENT